MENIEKKLMQVIEDFSNIEVLELEFKFAKFNQELKKIYDEKIKFIEVINNVCKNNQIETLYNIKGKKRLLIKEILDSADTDIEVKEMFKKLYQIIKECNRNYKNEV